MFNNILRRLKPNALDKFILKELIPSFFFGIVSFTIILVAGSLLFKIAELVIEQGISFGVVVRLFIYSLPQLMAYTIPMSCLLATLLGFGKMSANSEIVALKSAGLSFHRIVRPVIIMSIIVSLFALLLNETIVPLCEHARTNIMSYEVLKQSPVAFKEKIFIKNEQGGRLERVIYIDKMKLSNGDMKGILVQEFDEGRLARITSAEAGRWVNGSWWILNGHVYEMTKNGDVKQLYRFDKEALALNMTPKDVSKVSIKPKDMSMPELISVIKLYEKTGRDASALWMIFHVRLSVPWACVVLALVGAALGSRPQRSSSSVGLGVSVLIVFVYYVILSFAQSFGEARMLPPLLAAWLANIIFFAIGLYLCRNANNLG